jgi:phosphomannomutase
MLAQLEDAIAELEADLAAARNSGDADRIARAEEALGARRAWYDQIAATAADLS